MSSIDKLVEANRLFSLDYDPTKVSPIPKLHLAVLTCMDTRLSRAALGLSAQDAHLIRNAGGIVTEDAIRSLLVSHYLLQTQEIMIINHTDCGLMRANEQQIHDMIESQAGLPANSPVHFHAFTDVEKNVREQMMKLNEHSWIQTERVTIRGFVFDVHTGRLKEVQAV